MGRGRLPGAFFQEAFIPARPRSRRPGYTLPIPVIRRARGARWAGQAAETGEFPDVTVEAAGICPSSKQEPVWRTGHMFQAGAASSANPAIPFDTPRSDAAPISLPNVAAEFAVTVSAHIRKKASAVQK
ncbi:hypothetical protein L903_24270 [Agrobacterium sp. JL28]|nr:hypothetical protein L902_25980 [Agrobacterium radiobacter DSM 30147]KVK46112.1 hypothetical protein L904_23835 [Agrobacterium sp. LY4]KVK46312.1 hypothetical protein L903_24270 [Agrobacterium sp. JL28]